MNLKSSPGFFQGNNKSSVLWLIFITGFVLSTLASFYVNKKNINEDRLRIEYEKDSYLRRFQNRMESYEGALIQTRAYLLNSTSVNLKQLHQYFLDTELFERFPGLQGLGYSMLVRPQDLSSHLENMRLSIPEYHLWPSGKRDIYSSIIALEPANEQNKRALGYDMIAEPIRHKAMKEARDTNNAVISDKVVLVQEDQEVKLPGFLMYLPHYRANQEIHTQEKRRENILGYVYAPFRAPELFKAIIPESNFELRVKVYDGIVEDPEKLLFDSNGGKELDSFLERTETMTIYGKNFFFRFSTLPTFNKSSSTLKNVLVFLIGMLMTLSMMAVYIISRKQMTAMSLMAEEKERLLEKEKEHVAARDDFLSIASHELKTPLTSLKLQSQVMMRAIKRDDPDALSKDRVTSLIKQIDNQTTRLTRLVDDMLDISRIRTGRLKMEMEEVVVSDMIEEVLERLKPQFAQAGITPELDIQENIETCWDKFRIEQVVTNLLTNAIRYGKGKPVRLEVSCHEKIVTISVIDQGIGIAPENIDKIFNRFERAGMSANEVSGLGLGLFITNQIVKAHGGRIRVESKPQEGSAFHIHLPQLSKEQSS